MRMNENAERLQGLCQKLVSELAQNLIQIGPGARLSLRPLEGGGTFLA